MTRVYMLGLGRFLGMTRSRQLKTKEATNCSSEDAADVPSRMAGVSPVSVMFQDLHAIDVPPAPVVF